MNQEEVLETLKAIIDPEVGLNIVDLGLVYRVDIASNKIEVDMTMTTPSCPMGDWLQSEAQNTLQQKFPNSTVKVNLVWSPPWEPDKMSETARKLLGQ